MSSSTFGKDVMSIYPGIDITRFASPDKNNLPLARIASVEVDSPAYDAGFEAGCYVVSVDGHPIRDLIDWRWLTSEDCIAVGYVDLEGERGEIELTREVGESWGFTFDGVVFDTVKQCRNSCTFCFMKQLPKDLRPSLTLRDDDFRLSFLAGTFVTFTNITPEDEERIIQQHISPLRISIHAIDKQVRQRLIGRHAQHGIDVLERLLLAGIEFHAQIVLLPGENDGEVLRETLEWAYARPGIREIGIVPLGFTKYQKSFTYSFNDSTAAEKVLAILDPLQQRALAERNFAWVFAADEFYCNAYGTQVLKYLPSTSHYGDFGMYEDGIGIIRSFVDDWTNTQKLGGFIKAQDTLAEACMYVYIVYGEAMEETFNALLEVSDLRGCVSPLFVKNNFFGGNVDVTGLLCGCDIVEAIKEVCDQGKEHSLKKKLFVIPSVVFNDDNVALDDMSLEDIRRQAEARVSVVSCNPSEFLEEIIDLVKREAF